MFIMIPGTIAVVEQFVELSLNYRRDFYLSDIACFLEEVTRLNVRLQNAIIVLEWAIVYSMYLWHVSLKKWQIRYLDGMFLLMQC